MKKAILIAGFGGQGVLFSGKFLAYDGLLENREVSWLPSYGPEMRGGTCNCSVILSSTPVGSPIVDHPDILIAMNLPSLDKYEPTCVPGAQIFYDSSLIGRDVVRTDVDAFPIPATALAQEHGMEGLANMIILGHMMAKTGIIDRENIPKIMQKVVSARHKDLYDKNLGAVELGYHYAV